MNNAATAIRKLFTLNACMQTTIYGKEPALEIAAAKEISHRLLSAMMHRIAAEVELASDGEGWAVCARVTGDGTAQVYIETLTSKQEESERALKLLKAIRI